MANLTQEGFAYSNCCWGSSFSSSLLLCQQYRMKHSCFVLYYQIISELLDIYNEVKMLSFLCTKKNGIQCCWDEIKDKCEIIQRVSEWMLSLARWVILVLVYRLKIDKVCSEKTSFRWCSSMSLAWTRTDLALVPKPVVMSHFIYQAFIFFSNNSWKIQWDEPGFDSHQSHDPIDVSHCFSRLQDLRYNS